MLDIDLIRQKTDWVREQIAKLHDESALEHLEAVLKLDVQRRELITRVQDYKEARNKFSKGAGQLRGDKKLTPEVKINAAYAVVEAVKQGDLSAAEAYLNDPTSAPASDQGELEAAFEALFAALKTISNLIDEMDGQIRTIETDFNYHMGWIPNMPHSSVPYGASDEENIAHPEQGERRTFDFTPKPHWELGPALDMIDFERGTKLAGSRFYILRHNGARLYRALINWMLDEHHKAGFTELYLPYMVREEALYGAGQFPKFADVVYKDTDADMYFIPTSEVSMTNMYADEILEEAQLPMHFAAHTPCFRREKLSAGRDVRGIKRGHQFEKIELYKFTTPENSYDELESLMRQAEHVAGGLGIPYRRLEIVTGDLGFSAAKKYDLELYAPGCDEWLEVSSVSNTEAFQARRANIRYRPSDGGRPRFVHTLNGSGLGMPRALISVMEHYQQADGSLQVPPVLVPYMGGQEVIEPLN